jgi:hypothetical protein
VFYISGHGFGHASRQVEVINAVGARRPDTRLVIRSAVSADLLQRTVRVPYELRPGACDTGVIQTSSVAQDDAATAREAVAFYERFDERADAESASLEDVADSLALIVGDIPPLAFEVAARRRVPSVAIGNFTWDWIYETAPGFGDAGWLIARLRQAYAHAGLALELPFAGGFEVFPTSRRIPLIARHATRAREATRAHFGIAPDRRAVLLSFGGYGLPDLATATIDCAGAWTLVTTDRTLPADRGDAGVVMVREEQMRDSGFRYEDLVAAVDVVMSKPGYGIIAECIAAGTPLLYTSRGQFREYDLLVRDMPHYLRCRYLTQDDLFAGRWHAALDALLRQPPPPDPLATNGADIAAAQIVDALAMKA